MTTKLNQAMVQQDYCPKQELEREQKRRGKIERMMRTESTSS